MVLLQVPLSVWFILFSQIAGILCACLVRVAEGARWQVLCQRVFLFCLVLVGGAAVVSLGLGPGCWIGSGWTLSLMAIVATYDSGRSRRVAVW